MVEDNNSSRRNIDFILLLLQRWTQECYNMGEVKREGRWQGRRGDARGGKRWQG